MTLIAVMLLAIICLTFAGLAWANLKMAAEFQDAVAAQYVAEAAANSAVASFSKSSPDWNSVASGKISGVTYRVNFTPALKGTAIALPGIKYQATVTAKNKKAARVIKFSVTSNGEGAKPDVSNWQYY